MARDGKVADVTPEERFGRIVAAYVHRPGVTTGTGFGGNEGLRFQGRIFAMLVRRELVMKLTPDRVNAGAAAGEGRAFEPGTGRVMRAWFTVSADCATAWSDLVEEAWNLALAQAGS